MREESIRKPQNIYELNSGVSKHYSFKCNCFDENIIIDNCVIHAATATDIPLPQRRKKMEETKKRRLSIGVKWNEKQSFSFSLSISSEWNRPRKRFNHSFEWAASQEGKKMRTIFSQQNRNSVGGDGITNIRWHDVYVFNVWHEKNMSVRKQNLWYVSCVSPSLDSLPLRAPNWQPCRWSATHTNCSWPYTQSKFVCCRPALVARNPVKRTKNDYRKKRMFFFIIRSFIFLLHFSMRLRINTKTECWNNGSHCCL